VTTRPTDTTPVGEPGHKGGLDRRGFLGAAGGVAAAAAASGVIASCGGGATPAPPRAGRDIRLHSVKTPVDSGLMGHLLSRFERESGYRVHITTAEDVYGPARAGKADVVLSHYGHVDVHQFVLSGYGEWPLMVLQNQLALVGPPADPAYVRGLNDLVEAYRSIARSQSPYVVDAIPELRYLNDIIDHAAGNPPKGAWHHDPGLTGQDAVKYAAAHQAYTLFGVTPFMVGQAQRHLEIVPLVLTDPMLLRVMATIVVSPKKVGGLNHAGALALQRHLLTSQTQAEIRDYRVPGVKEGLWWPAGRNNEATLNLPQPAAATVGTGSGAGSGGGGGTGGGGKHQKTSG
jgi:tungstate transport system substrate-binding protein